MERLSVTIAEKRINGVNVSSQSALNEMRYVGIFMISSRVFLLFI